MDKDALKSTHARKKLNLLSLESLAYLGKVGVKLLIRSRRQCVV